MADDTQAQKRGYFHAVRFYEDDVALCQVVADFLREGLVTLEPGLVIATPEHQVEIRAQLQTRGFDVALLTTAGDLLIVDAEATLREFMIDGMPDPSRFRRTMIPLIERACRGRKDCTIRAYGEMVDLLWRRGQSVAAIRLETLWNDLARTQDFSLLCGYSMGNFYKHATSEDTDVDRICRHHTHVVSETGEAARVD
jgi:hypothetical protein